MPQQEIKIMVSSTVQGFKDRLTQICAIIEGYSNAKYKYKIISSHLGTVFPGNYNAEACLDAVKECDFFLGIIFPRYGSGIAHQEFTEAIKLNKPRWFLVNHTIPFARLLLQQYMYTSIKFRRRNRSFKFKKISIFDDIRLIDMYNEAIMDGKPVKKRKWAQEFGHTGSDEFNFLRTLFEDTDRLAIMAGIAPASRQVNSPVKRKRVKKTIAKKIRKTKHAAQTKKIKKKKP